ncbi:lactoylglutathione lyase [Orenia metallireducens]|uniref:Lactoylglutathione lyase n=1 Tax=Orenia metallireducens TaxID=1413210 RepID=A0A285HKC1_9FIRM|nr:VOC family protein [Orenia metallireducens]PRX27187.1 lactoylglutathione lyase [Orenia metallireducens]SNY35216.1 lactoylglutathione lyase [Orenia metallireducens]
MRIEHIAIWTDNLERLKEFYSTYFNATAGDKYINESKNFESYFLSFDQGCRLEIMHKPSIPKNLNNTADQCLGLIHFAISVGSKNKVLALTERLEEDGYEVIGEPRMTGDGYFESVILDPDGNRIEITT